MDELDLINPENRSGVIILTNRAMKPVHKLGIQILRETEQYLAKKSGLLEDGIPVFSEEDVDLVAQQTGVDREKARKALIEAKGDLARAILLLTTG